MTQLLKFRKRSKVPAVKRNEVVLFADQDGVIKKRDDDGTVSDVGGGGSLTGYVVADGGDLRISAIDSGTVHISDGDGSEQISVSGGTVAFGANFEWGALRNDRGQFYTSSHFAPGDDDLTAGQLCIYFDPNPGQAKLKIKAKDANGTVVTGSVNLT